MSEEKGRGLSGLRRLWRSPHVRRCVPCKLFLDRLAEERDPARLITGKGIVARHMEMVPEGEDLPCAHSGCILHEPVPFDLALAIIRVGRGGPRMEVGGGVELASVPLGRSEGVRRLARPFPAWSMQPGDLFLRIRPERCRAHVRVNRRHLALEFLVLPVLWSGPHELREMRAEARDPRSIWRQIENFEERFLPALRATCLSLYKQLRELAGMDLQFGK